MATKLLTFQEASKLTGWGVTTLHRATLQARGNDHTYGCARIVGLPSQRIGSSSKIGMTVADLKKWNTAMRKRSGSGYYCHFAGKKKKRTQKPSK